MEAKKSYSLKSALWFVFAFSLVIVAATWLLSPLLAPFRATLLPDSGAAWYYWKLPRPELWASSSMWVLYLAHQITVWVLIAKLKNSPYPQAGTIGKYNLQLLIANAVFIVLHLVQTVLFYDALAQFTPVMSSQGSVIVMLVMMLILLNSRRGLFFGKKVYLPPLGVAATQKVHGFYIAWAVVFTFWFHPMEGTLGHLLGFFYLFLLMGQLSLARTTWHTKIGWLTFLEVFVAIHGAIVAINAGNGMWPMFFFGFMMMFILTQMFGIIKSWLAAAGVFASYAALVAITYSGALGSWLSGTPVGWTDIHQITWIPVILYGLVFVVAWLFAGVYALIKKAKKS
ncbi:MAG: hypothetical protein CVV04_14050 [Firmicutes bacterium HGW-Firmicutes-9]|jgi:hypothetical protein|nr:MAG: hypothetical protein CVV04_14050 [Firmicutes bacterium HGW-Firmicutes-9]